MSPVMSAAEFHGDHSSSGGIGSTTTRCRPVRESSRDGAVTGESGERSVRDRGNTIGWIERLPDDPDSIPVDRLIDRPEAIRIAREEDLEIPDLEETVDRYIRTIPGLLIWFRRNYRVFPWRETRDPWAVLLAEILLQRTRASTVAREYPAILDRFPDPRTAHDAKEPELFEAVKSLGFGNKRATTIRELADALVNTHDGEVPRNRSRLQELPRIGPYTARACLCFAFGERLALIDRNVEVVMRRVFDYSSSERAHKDEKLYAFLDALVPADEDLVRGFNLAVLDLRDAVCLDPPQCASCPHRDGCLTGRQR